ncbi:MAG: L-threonylcarbamoyladenylate synthase [Pseudomonadota bacterium]
MSIPIFTDPEQAADLLRSGALVAFGTETVYGLGADARSDEAVAKIYSAKSRPMFNPLIAHVATLSAAEALIDLGAQGRALAETFWPGPLTLVGPLRDPEAVSGLVTAGLPTLAVRIPDNAMALKLLELVDAPVAAPSANPSGKLSPTTAMHVAQELGPEVAGVLDTGPCTVGLESTIISLEGAPTLLRHGGLPNEALEEVLGHALQTLEKAQTITAPGQLASHYAPRAGIRLNAMTAQPGEAHLGFGEVEGDLNLSPDADLTQAAKALFEALRRLDITGAGVIAVAPIPQIGLGRAINDRLQRAAAPRPDSLG